MRIIGITHQRIEKGRFVEEWTEYSELNLLKQLLLPLSTDTEQIHLPEG